MRDFNNITVMGRLGSELRLFGEGEQRGVGFSLACSSDYKKGDGWVEQTDWYDVSVFGRSADSLVGHVAKGGRVIVQGRQGTRTYEKDGVTRTSVTIRANAVQIIDRLKAESNGEEVPF